MKKEYCSVYILSSKKKGTLYVDMTSNLPQRIWEHKNKVVEGFTKKYDVNRLVYYEMHNNTEGAIKRERRLKEWQRKWKIDLIEEKNPEWEDLYNEIIK